MTKNLKLSFILYLVFSAIISCWRTLLNFFSGAGISFVAIVGILAVLLYLLISDEYVRNRTKDMFIVACIITAFELLVYIIFEFGVSNYRVIKAFLIIQNILTAFGLFFLLYVFMRLFTEMKGVKLTFVEIMLGNEKREKHSKQAKELSNGSLEEKPNQKQEEKIEEQETEKVEDVESREE